MKYLLDTNIIIDLLRNRAPEVARKIADVGISECCMSDITLYELYCGAYSSANPLEEVAKIDNIATMIAIVQTSFKAAASQKALLKAKGQMIEDFDIMIGTTAEFNGLTLVTNNKSHMSRLHGVRIEDWTA